MATAFPWVVTTIVHFSPTFYLVFLAYSDLHALLRIFFFGFGVVLGLELDFKITILPLKNYQNYKRKKMHFVFRSGIHLATETARFRRYGRYFFLYEIGGVPIPVHWLVRYIPVGTVRYHPHCLYEHVWSKKINKHSYLSSTPYG